MSLGNYSKMLLIMQVMQRVFEMFKTDGYPLIFIILLFYYSSFDK